MSRISSPGRYTQSFGTKDICILLVNDDHICRNIVVDMLKHCRYEGFRYIREMDALNIIRDRKDELESVLTNVHRTDANMFGIIKHMEKEFKLQIILLSPDIDDVENMSKRGGNGVTVYILKSLSLNEINNLWENALVQEKRKRDFISENLVQECVENEISLAANEARKRKIEISEQTGGSKDESNVEKKPRVVWNKELHQRFLDAIVYLGGHDRAFPKRIVEVMDIPGLTRENVASHLQKYRTCMKRAEEEFTCSSYDSTNSFGFNKFHLSPFKIGSSKATRNHFGFNYNRSRLRTPRDISLLNATQFEKPKYNFRVYGDEKKNVLLGIGESSVPSNNSSFIGFRLGGDGKSIGFGQNGHLGVDGWIKCPLVEQQQSFREMGNDDSTLCPSFSVNFTLQQQQQQPPVAPSGWDQAASFTEPPGADWAEPASFTHQLYSVSQLENEVNANSHIFSDFMLEFCEPETITGDNDGVVDMGETARFIFDDLLLDHQDIAS